MNRRKKFDEEILKRINEVLDDCKFEEWRAIVELEPHIKIIKRQMIDKSELKEKLGIKERL